VQPQNEVHPEELTTYWYNKAIRSLKADTRTLEEAVFKTGEVWISIRLEGDASKEMPPDSGWGNETMDDTSEDVDWQLPCGNRAGSGVEDTSLLQRFLLNDNVNQTAQTSHVPQVPQAPPIILYLKPCRFKVGVGASSCLLII